jgi:hypothetical protein
MRRRLKVALAVAATAAYFATAAYLKSSFVEPDHTVIRGTFRRVDNSNAYYVNDPVIFGPTEAYTVTDTEVLPTRSRVRLFEDDRELGPAHSDRPDIMLFGSGRFTHVMGPIPVFIMSTSDNSDPNTNGRTYRAVR